LLSSFARPRCTVRRRILRRGEINQDLLPHSLHGKNAAVGELHVLLDGGGRGKRWISSMFALPP
jgi:hypothetical protein